MRRHYFRLKNDIMSICIIILGVNIGFDARAYERKKEEAIR